MAGTKYPHEWFALAEYAYDEGYRANLPTEEERNHLPPFDGLPDEEAKPWIEMVKVAVHGVGDQCIEIASEYIPKDPTTDGVARTIVRRLREHFPRPDEDPAVDALRRISLLPPGEDARAIALAALSDMGLL